MRTLLEKISDHIAFLRPLLWIPVWIPAFLGFRAANGSGGAKGYYDVLSLATFLASGIYGLNQIYDIASDRLNKKNLPLALRLISPFMAWLLTISSFVGALLVGCFFSLPVALMTIAAIALGIFYSAPPWRLKDRAYYALAANAVGHGALMYMIGNLCAVSSSGKFEWFSLVRSLSFAFAYGAVYIFTTVPDIEGDRLTGKKTISVILGQRKAMAIGLLGIFLAGATGLIFGETSLWLTAVLSMPFYIAAVSDPIIENDKILRANKVAIFLMAIFTWLSCLFFPLLILPIIAAIAFAFIYNRARLGVKYP